ncbi:uncharacterized protein PV07_06215 [Cladophialophora immunda]|uniref:Uncharacterized protein n=1 Tax=Cladophialophora immunda TaxID=569365 RepID=A0A0D2CH92_9EURO|nr:uncharacterized protein PV07_06215 [Cladophialophora immunda]KIW30473.1 hypothetical protein PV07_06215 [Cladophialophora immunda]OQU97058.1 hypothetical protein CLAIMM_03060 [Cladophialophora immunda]
MRICRSKRSNISPTVPSASTQPQPQPQSQPMCSGSDYDSAAESHTVRITSIDSCSGCAYIGCDSRRHGSRAGRHRHHQCAASPVGLLISGMTQTMRSLQAMNEQERIAREQTERGKDPKEMESSDDGKDFESTRDMDGESETGSELEGADTVSRRKYEQHLEDNPGKDLPGYQSGMAGT